MAAAIDLPWTAPSEPSPLANSATPITPTLSAAGCAPRRARDGMNVNAAISLPLVAQPDFIALHASNHSRAAEAGRFARHALMPRLRSRRQAAPARLWMG